MQLSYSNSPSRAFKRDGLLAVVLSAAAQLSCYHGPAHQLIDYINRETNPAMSHREVSALQARLSRPAVESPIEWRVQFADNAAWYNGQLALPSERGCERMNVVFSRVDRGPRDPSLSAEYQQVCLRLGPDFLPGVRYRLRGVPCTSYLFPDMKNGYFYVSVVSLSGGQTETARLDLARAPRFLRPMLTPIGVLAYMVALPLDVALCLVPFAPWDCPW